MPVGLPFSSLLSFRKYFRPIIMPARLKSILFASLFDNAIVVLGRVLIWRMLPGSYGYSALLSALRPLRAAL
jgi:hypothetical protein